MTKRRSSKPRAMANGDSNGIRAYVGASLASWLAPLVLRLVRELVEHCIRELHAKHPPPTDDPLKTELEV